MMLKTFSTGLCNHSKTLISFLRPTCYARIFHKQAMSTDSERDDDTFSLSKIPRRAAALGFSGAIPFISMATASCFSHPYIEMVAIGQVSYAACILTFLGGVHWGKELILNGNNPETKTLTYSVLPSLCAWSAFAMPTSVALYYLAGGLLCVAVIDTRDRSLPLWYRQMRVPLTVLASSSVFLTAVNLTGNFLAQ